MTTNLRWILSISMVDILHERLVEFCGEVRSEAIDQVGAYESKSSIYRYVSWSAQITVYSAIGLQSLASRNLCLCHIKNHSVVWALETISSHSSLLRMLPNVFFTTHKTKLGVETGNEARRTYSYSKVYHCWLLLTAC